VLNQDETPLLYSLVFGEGVVNDATSVVLFNAIQNIDLDHFDAFVLLQLIGKFLYLLFTSTVLGIAVSYLCHFCDTNTNNVALSCESIYIFLSILS
jgi:NhaP-type Na+/H+ or K+/H+ antiporter